MVETVLKIVIFLKILDADLTKITKMPRKTCCIEAIDENRRFFSFRTLWITVLKQFETDVELVFPVAC